MSNLMTFTQEAKVDNLIERTTESTNFLEDVVANLKVNVPVDTATAIAGHNNNAGAHSGITILIKDEYRAEVESATSGRNTIIRDNQGAPHMMVVMPRFNLQDIDASLGTGTHPAFIVNGVTKTEVLIGKYLASNNGGRVATLAKKVPWVNINFDAAVTACRDLGTGFGLCSNAIYAAHSLWLWKHMGSAASFGNTNYGRDYVKTHQVGTLKSVTHNPGDTGLVDAATLTGTGPVEWNTDGTPYGVSDLLGNISELLSGVQLRSGEIQIIPDNDAMLASADFGVSSSQWRAILENGSLVAPGTANTMKFDASDSTGLGYIILSKSITSSGGAFNPFKNIENNAGIASVPAILKSLGLFPVAQTGVDGYIFIDNSGDKNALRYSHFSHGNIIGKFMISLSNNILNSDIHFGFRLAFVA